MMTTTNSQPAAPHPAATKDLAENQSLTRVSINSLIGSLRLNLTQPECNDGGLRG